MHLAEKNDPATFARDRRIKRRPLSARMQATLDPTTTEMPREQHSHRRAERGAEHIEQKSPPQPEEQSRADGEHAAGQEQHVARGEEQRVKHRAPYFEFGDFPLRARDVFRDR